MSYKSVKNNLGVKSFAKKRKTTIHPKRLHQATKHKSTGSNAGDFLMGLAQLPLLLIQLVLGLIFLVVCGSVAIAILMAIF